MPVEQDFDVEDFSDRLKAMSNDELFAIMQRLELESADIPSEKRDASDVFAKIALVETAIEGRFPGQLLAPYKDWQQHGSDL
ncbi:hypothetical protein BLJAPNOD_05344 [Ensifer sp. M14]|uniref:hypothetical protein n=1 Tax=Sinorhizobium/Ensifer group TaxID=227292 RepID=UPI00098693F1|nr:MULTISPECIES: hypothetical protein [Sinorhizobium/Ensifer group]OOG61814.1 hypothetical protein B0E45_32265 [Sinorhizobium sp. A49]RDL47844.1 hypothetical protein BLJAPNOD_05344 [Ensifer sp. M14]